MILGVGWVKGSQDITSTLNVIFNDRLIIDFIKCSTKI